jgi:hypothetical protein
MIYEQDLKTQLNIKFIFWIRFKVFFEANI